MSFLSTYQGRKTLFASKLNSKGVSEARASDGLTTLINYIDSIPSGVRNGIILVADKDIIQKNGTTRVSAMALQNEKLLNSKIDIYSVKSSLQNNLTVNANGFDTISGNGFTISSNGALLTTYNNHVCCNHKMNLRYNSIFIHFLCKKDSLSASALTADIDTYGYCSEYNTGIFIDDDGISFFEESASVSGIDLTDWIDVRIEILPSSQKMYIDDVLVVEADKDFTSSDFDTLVSNDLYLSFFVSMSDDNGFYLKNFSIDVLNLIASGDNGSASGVYTGSGVGKINMLSKCSSLQETYEILDAMYYDKALTGNYNDAMWYLYYATLTRGDDGTTMTTSNAWGGIQVGTTSSAQSVPTPCVLEFEVLEMTTGDSGDFFQIRPFGASGGDWYLAEGTGTYRVEIGTNSQRQFINGVEQPSSARDFSNGVRIFFGSTSANDTLKFKDLKIYPI